MTEEIEIRTTAALRLIGSKQEILIVLEGLAHKGFKWKTNGKYYSQRDNPSRFAYYLNYLYVPSVDYRPFDVSTSGFSDNQPRSGDMVLGGNNPPNTHILYHHTPPHQI
jgi:hypothetical protein